MPAILKMTGRAIRTNLARFMAILFIVALSAGFFSGLKISTDAMLNTGDKYLDEQKFYDFRLFSTIGFTEENVEEFLSGLSDFVEGRKEEDLGDHVSLTDFLQEVSLMTDLDSDGDSDEPKVVLMTIHAAKGLEFKTVFVVGLEENIFPSPMCSDSMRGLEEERRLLYVAITRAEKHCFLTCAQNRFRYGRMEFGFLNFIVSLFIAAFTQSGIMRSFAKSPPPITFPALAVDMAHFFSLKKLLL